MQTLLTQDNQAKASRAARSCRYELKLVADYGRGMPVWFFRQCSDMAEAAGVGIELARSHGAELVAVSLITGGAAVPLHEGTGE